MTNTSRAEKSALSSYLYILRLVPWIDILNVYQAGAYLGQKEERCSAASTLAK